MYIQDLNANVRCVYATCVITYVLKAAANTRLDVGAAKGSHLPQLPRDLDGFMEQQTELPLVTRVTCRCYLAEEVCEG